MDQYFLSDQPSKSLLAQHFHSSLNEPNLDNVEAKLYATRQKNHELAMQYFQNKYGNTQIYEDFARSHNLGEFQKVNSQVQTLEQHLERKARQIQAKERQKYLTRKNDKNDLNDSVIQQQESFDFRNDRRGNTNKQKKHSKNNPWLDKNSRNDHKQKQSTFSAQIVDSIHNQPKNKENQFINEFKKYLINRNKNTPNEFQALQTNNSSMFNPSQIARKSDIIINQSNIKEEEPMKKRNYEEELAKKVFKEISGAAKDNTKIEKLRLVEYLVKNKKIMRVLDQTQESLSHNLLSEYQTSLQTQINLQQFLFFILEILGKESQINQIKQQKREKHIPEGCLLEKDMILHFQEIFKQLDKHTDLIVRRLQYTNILAQDALVKKIIDQPAVYEEQLDKLVSLRRILQRIQLEAILGTQEQQKVKEYISWGDFLGYFRSGSQKRGQYDLVVLVDSLKQQEKFGLMELSDQIQDIILDAIKKQDRGNQFFNTQSLIDQISRHRDFDHEKYALARQQSKITNLPSETFEEVLTRIKENAPKFLTIKEFYEYFSSKGKPNEEINQSKIKNTNKNFSVMKVQFAEKDKKQNVDGYDSDPEMYSSQVANSPRRTARSAKKLAISQNKEEYGTDFEIQEAKIKKKQFKVTIPQPFSFEERQKNRDKKQTHSSITDQFESFRAKSIPAKVKDETLYQRMLQEDKKRAQQRKKNNMIITLANQKPFSFLDRKTNKKTKEEREQFVFKAKPIPWYCSVDLLEKKRESEMVRNEKIAKQAQESLAKAKLPPRMERDYQEKLAKKAQMPNSVDKKSKKNTLYREPPDFDRIHREFEQGLERKRKQTKVTQPQQFNLSKPGQTKAKTVMNFVTDLSFVNDKKDSQAYKKHLQTRVVAKSTLKYTQQVEQKRKELEEKRMKEEKKRKQEQQRAQIDKELQKKLKGVIKNKEDKQKQEKEEQRRHMQELHRKHIEWKKNCIEKGRQQPLLVDRPLKRDQKIEKMKKLAQISKTLRENGIKGKDHDSYFKREELLLLQDWQQLKDRLK